MVVIVSDSSWKGVTVGLILWKSIRKLWHNVVWARQGRVATPPHGTAMPCPGCTPRTGPLPTPACWDSVGMWDGAWA